MIYQWYSQYHLYIDVFFHRFKLNFCLLIVLLSIFLEVREGKMFYYSCIIDAETQENWLTCLLIVLIAKHPCPGSHLVLIAKHPYPGSHLVPLLVYKTWWYNHVPKLPKETSFHFLFPSLIPAHPSKFSLHPASLIHHFKHWFSSYHSH